MKFSRIVKKFLYGTLPYSLHKTFKHDSELQRYYEYIMRYGYSRHLFEFRHEYKADDIDVLFDDDASHHYVISPNGHRLYFKKGMSTDKIRGLYNELLIEQDKRSAHRYFDNPSELDDYTILDVGAAEGL
ncbi:MAG: methyltransferase, partial [Muribaculaceae bacterium]|nr:methyltransferase [Muribaculaceae bacterium]